MVEVIEQSIIKTKRYGTIVFSHVKDKGWTYQYDSVLIFGNENYGEIPRYLLPGTQESGTLFPELDEIDSENFYPSLTAAHNIMISDMTNAFYMGTIAGFC